MDLLHDAIPVVNRTTIAIVDVVFEVRLPVETARKTPNVSNRQNAIDIPILTVPESLILADKNRRIGPRRCCDPDHALNVDAHAIAHQNVTRLAVQIGR